MPAVTVTKLQDLWLYIFINYSIKLQVTRTNNLIMKRTPLIVKLNSAATMRAYWETPENI